LAASRLSGGLSSPGKLSLFSEKTSGLIAKIGDLTLYRSTSYRLRPPNPASIRKPASLSPPQRSANELSPLALSGWGI
jgi:hypothetical protein